MNPLYAFRMASADCISHERDARTTCEHLRAYVRWKCADADVWRLVLMAALHTQTHSHTHTCAHKLGKRHALQAHNNTAAVAEIYVLVCGAEHAVCHRRNDVRDDFMDGASGRLAQHINVIVNS